MATEGDLAGLIARHGADLLARPGVIGIGEGLRDGAPCVVVFVDRSSPVRPDVPATIDGHPVVLEVVPRFEAHPG